MSCEPDASPTCDAANRPPSCCVLMTRISGSLARYQAEFRGIAEYYQMAYNRHRLGLLRWIMERSLTKKTLVQERDQRQQGLARHRATWHGGPRLAGHGRTRPGEEATGCPAGGASPCAAPSG